MIVITIRFKREFERNDRYTCIHEFDVGYGVAANLLLVHKLRRVEDFDRARADFSPWVGHAPPPKNETPHYFIS